MLAQIFGSGEFDDRLPSLNRTDDVRELCFETAQELNATSISDSDPNNRRAFVQKSMDGEIVVLRNDHRSGLSSVRANFTVRGLRQSTIRHVLGDVAERFNSSCEGWRELSVDEEAQSCAPQDRVIVLLGGELQDRSDVVGFQIGIVRQDLFARGAGGEKVEHVFDADAETANARTTAADIRIHGDSVHRAHWLSLYRGSSVGEQYGFRSARLRLA